MEYSPPELQAPRSNVADQPWPQAHSHTQRPHGENTKHTTRERTSVLNKVLVGVRGHGERAAGKAGGKGRHAVQQVEDAGAEHDFLGCMSR